MSEADTIGLTRRLAAFVAGARFEHLSAETVRMTRLSLLDAVGVTLAASSMGEGVAAFADVARETGGRPEAAVIGFGFHTSMLGAVIANGAGAHALDYEDAYDGAPIHPNAACVPVALAVGQATNASGPAILTALAVGCDLVCRLGLALGVNPDDAGWYPPPILSTFGAAATAANLLGLDADQTAAALALALNQATATAQFKTDPASTLRAVRDAFPAHAGLLAAQLAKRGVRGFDGVFEGRAGLFALFSQGRYDATALTDGLGERFHGDRLSFKLWPSCRGTHAFIEAALTLRTQYRSPDHIAEIVMTGGAVQRMLVEPQAQKQAPQTAIDAKFSLPFTTAAALVHGRIDLDSFTRERLTDSDVLGLAARSRFEVDPTATIREAAAGRLELRLRDGRTLSAHVPHPLGAPQNPADDAGLIAKFLDCAGRSAVALEAGGAVKIAEVLLALDDVDAPTSVLASLSGSGQD
ncbi:MmgE/PrpD family protein [soil metagenome]